MGKALVLSSDGTKYNIRLLKKADYADAKIAKYETAMADIDQQIEDQEDALAAAQDAASSALLDLDLAIEGYRNGTVPAEDVTKLSADYQTMITGIKLLENQIAILRLNKQALEKEHARLLAAIADVDVADAWCADDTPGLTGDVGTIELNGETSTILVAPGGAVPANVLEPALGMPVSGTAFSWTVFPGWQKFQPTYRAGAITSIDHEANTCNVTLDPALSAMRGMDINQEPTLSNVTIRYMTCNSHAFSVGDHVVVEFTDQDWTKPVVIGFVEDPSGCNLQALIQFQSATGNADFAAVADRRIAELQRDRAFAVYAHDVYVPAVLAYYDGRVGECISSTLGMCWLRFSQAMADQAKAEYIAWRDSQLGTNQDLGYQSYIDAVDNMISLWTAAKAANAAIATSARVDCTGHLDPGDDTSAALLAAAGLVVDCCSTDPLTEITGNTTANPMQKTHDLADEAKAAWDAAESACAPILSAQIYIPGGLSWSWSMRGLIDSAGIFYLLTSGYSYYVAGVPGGQVETLSITVTVDGGRSVFEWPSTVGYHVNWWPIAGSGAESHITLSVRVKGRLAMIPAEFGAEVGPDGPEISDDPYTWMGSYNRESEVPQGYEMFAGRYYDHPIVTRSDLKPPIAYDLDQARALLAQVNDYVNGTYAAHADEETYDDWTFMSPSRPFGDCEDFAITKIQMLLDARMTIAALKLEVGVQYRSYSPRVYDDDGNEIKARIGHAWLVAYGSIVLDVSPGLKTITDMDIYSERRIQVDGTTWQYRDSGALITAYPWPHYEFDAALCTITAAVSRN